MAKGKKKEKKNPYDALPDDFKSFVDGAALEGLKDKLGEVAKMEEQNLAACKADGDLNTKREAVKFAMEPYKEIAKMSRLKKKYLIQALADKGDKVSESIVRLDLAASDLKAQG